MLNFKFTQKVHRENGISLYKYSISAWVTELAAEILNIYIYMGGKVSYV